MNAGIESHLKRYLRNSINLALQDKLSWTTLVSLLDDMTSTLDQCKELINILLEELLTMHKQKQVETMPDAMPEMIEVEKEETTNEPSKRH